jgi:hypothetical protein
MNLAQRAGYDAVRAVQPALTNLYNGLSDEQNARFNTLGSNRQGV